eukprot:9278441-Pyramimonas_sp.AAC.1
MSRANHRGWSQRYCCLISKMQKSATNPSVGGPIGDQRDHGRRVVGAPVEDSVRAPTEPGTFPVFRPGVLLQILGLACLSPCKFFQHLLWLVSAPASAGSSNPGRCHFDGGSRFHALQLFCARAAEHKGFTDTE